MKGTTRTLLIALAMATVLATVTTGAALAGKCDQGNNPHCAGSGGGGGSISLVLINSSDGLPHYGHWVTFDVATTATDKPWVELDCYQGDALVYQDWRGFFDGSLTGENFILGTTTAWQSGDADCTAWLEMYSKQGWQPLASTSFHVYA